MKKFTLPLFLLYFISLFCQTSNGDNRSNATDQFMIKTNISLTTVDFASKKLKGSIYIDKDFNAANITRDNKIYLTRYDAYKDEMEVEVETLTIAELLRVYLNKDNSVSFAAWKREHPTENPILSVKTKGKAAKKAVSDAVNAITKDLDKFGDDFKKLK